VTEYEIADINPLIIHINHEKWTHPYIKDWFTPDLDDTHDTSMYHVEIKTKTDHITIFFKSDYLDEKMDAFFSQDDWEDLPKNTLFEDPYVNCGSVYTGVEMTLLEDFWCPTKPRTEPIKNSREYEKWRKECPTYQFRFSDFGKKVAASLNGGFQVVRFTPDCGLTTDGEDWWCDS
jgi:hypothetical protein